MPPLNTPLQGCILSPYIFNLMAELLMRKALDGYDGGFKIGRRCVTNLRYVVVVDSHGAINTSMVDS